MNKDSIYLTIPSKPDYVSLARLTLSSVAHGKGLSIDVIEDLKVSIGEACINALESTKKDNISIVFETGDDKILVKVSDYLEETPAHLEESKERELGILIIKSLMDEVEFTNDGIEMTKYIV